MKKKVLTVVISQEGMVHRPGFVVGNISVQHAYLARLLETASSKQDWLVQNRGIIGFILYVYY